MIRLKSRAAIVLFFCCFICVALVCAQDQETDLNDLKESAPKVFIDCRGCDRNYFRDNITYVNYVRDRTDADVHILITQQSTGSGGREYTFAFIGLKECADVKHTLVCTSGPSDTRDEIRQAQLEVLERGLFPYLVETPIAEHIFLDFRKRLEPTAVVDPWKFWVFSISADGRISGEAKRSSRSLDVNVSANKVTPDIKIRLGLSGDFDKRVYDYEDETITSTSEQKNFSGMVVKSINRHWSIGGWVEAESSTYRNLDYQITVAPAVEYDYFPYAESTRRQLRFLYRIGWNSNNYTEKTIFDKTSENLFKQSLTASLTVREPWGSISTSLEGSHYFHDFSRNRLRFRMNIDLRIFKGLSLDIFGRYERIHDQMNLSIGEATLDEVLLQRKELATDYEYSISIGLRYTFGSVYSNVVNPRFGRTRF